MNSRDTRALYGRVLAMLAPVALACTPGIGAAQPSGAEGDYFLYRAVEGDTLIGLSQRYTRNENNWRDIQNVSQVDDPTRLPISKTVRIPFALIPEDPAAAHVDHVMGEASVNGVPLKAGASVKENDEISTGKQGFVTLVLSDGSKISLPPSSSLRIERLRSFQETGLSDAILTITEGGVESNVAPDGSGVGRFEIRTPVTITGVRGTRLRVRANQQGSQSEVLTGAAAVAASGQGTATLSKGQGAATSSDGTLLGVRPLLEAPAITQPKRGEGGWVSQATPVPGAAAYLARVTLDKAGTQVVFRKEYPTPDFRFSVSKPGTLYLWARAIDKDGVMGSDATQPFENTASLRSGFDIDVQTQFGEPVLLRDF